MTEIQKLVESLVKCQSKSSTLISIGIALNDLRCKSHYTDRQLERFLDDLTGQLKHKRTTLQPTDLIVSCAERFRKQVHQSC